MCGSSGKVCSNEKSATELVNKNRILENELPSGLPSGLPSVARISGKFLDSTSLREELSCHFFSMSIQSVEENIVSTLEVGPLWQLVNAGVVWFRCKKRDNHLQF